jgi:FkbM family methyltransferase
MKFTQNDEESHILNYFGDHVGTFLSLGENDGETFSNVRALALKGWKGVMVEPSPKAFEKLKALYDGNPGFYIYPFAIASHNGKAMLNESGPLINSRDVALVSTFHESEMSRFKTSVTYTPVEVKTFRWKTFLNRIPIKKFDFVSCDCEGQDLDILSQMDLKDTRCICLEWNGKEDLKKEFERHLSGFNLIYTSGENVLYAR